MAFVTEEDIDMCIHLDILLDRYLQEHDRFMQWNINNYSTDELLKWCLIRASREQVKHMIKVLEEKLKKEGLA